MLALSSSSFQALLATLLILDLRDTSDGRMTALVMLNNKQQRIFINGAKNYIHIVEAEIMDHC